jgi:hypothetical protein
MGKMMADGNYISLDALFLQTGKNGAGVKLGVAREIKY